LICYHGALRCPQAKKKVKRWMNGCQVAYSRFRNVPRSVRPSSRGSRVRVAGMPMTRRGLSTVRHLPGQLQYIMTYGAMMILAPGTGNSAVLCPSVRGPMHLTGVLTAASQPSSWVFSCDLEALYQESAWVASRMTSLLAILRGESVGTGEVCRCKCLQ